VVSLFSPSSFAHRLTNICRYTSSHEAGQEQPLTLRACSTVSFALGTNNASSAHAQPPYTLLVFPANGVPQTIPAGIDGTDADWRVNYPVGTQLLLSMVDSKGLPGGTSAPTTVIGGTSSCLSDADTPSLSLGYTPSVPSTCQSVSMLPDGGVPPYTITIQKAADQGINITQVTNTTSWINDMQAGGAVICTFKGRESSQTDTCKQTRFRIQKALMQKPLRSFSAAEAPIRPAFPITQAIHRQARSHQGSAMARSQSFPSGFPQTFPDAMCTGTRHQKVS
jgi:hypothetical protein